MLLNVMDSEFVSVCSITATLKLAVRNLGKGVNLC